MKPWHSAPCASSLPSYQPFNPFPAIPYWEVISSWYLKGKNVYMLHNSY